MYFCSLRVCLRTVYVSEVISRLVLSVKIAAGQGLVFVSAGAGGAGLTKWARRGPPAGEAAGCSVAKTKGRNLLRDSGHNYE